MRSLLFLMMLPSVAGATNVRAVMEGIAATQNTIFVDTNNVRVGIGTVNGGEPLSVSANGTADISISTANGIVSPQRWIMRAGDQSSSDFAIIQKGNGTKTSRMNIDGSGNVGINTASPQNLLHIKGSGTSGQVTAARILENSSSGSFGEDITGTAGSSRYRMLSGGGPGTGTNSMTERLSLILEGGSAGNVGIGKINPQNILDIGTGASPRVSIDGTTDARLFFQTSGTTKWQIGTGISGTNELGIYDQAGGAEVMHFKSGGNVGIGTTGPGSNLEIFANNSTLTQNMLTVKGGGSVGAFGFSVQANNGDKILYTDNLAYNVIMGTTGGLVGINKTSPSYPLDVGGTAQVTTLRFSGDGTTMTSAANLGFVSSQTLSSGQSSLALNFPVAAGDMYKIEFALKQLTGQGHISLLFNNVSTATYQSGDYKFDSTGGASADSGNAASEVYIMGAGQSYYNWPLVGSCLVEIDPDNTGIAFASCNTSGSADNTHEHALVSGSWFKTGGAITTVNFSDSANTFKGRVRVTKIQ